jgi:heme/copper-type cytochrome/quinol oxidase subunit 3
MKFAELAQPRRTSVVQSTLILVLGAETVLFGTLVMSYLFLRSGGSSLHFSHPRPLDIVIASLNTVILLTSATFARHALQAITKDHVNRLKTNLMLALMLGTVFIAGQIFEFNHTGMRINDSTFGGVFFALIGFHALHVLAGMTVLALNAARARLGDFSARRHAAVTAGTWFWYYVTAVWLVLFTVLYVV